MITLLTTFAPIRGDWGQIQKIAAYSFSTLGCQVIVLGNDFGVDEICRKYGFLQIKDILVGKDIGVQSSNGIVLGDAFLKANRYIKEDVVIYINGDNIIMPNSPLVKILPQLMKEFNGDFGGWGRRHEAYDYRKYIDLSEELAYEDTTLLYGTGKLRRILYGIDIYLWSRPVFEKIRL